MSAPAIIAVASDFAGLKRAALELMEEARSAPARERMARLAANSANPDEVLRGSGCARSMADGYYMRVGYLMELESFLSMGIRFQFDLDLAEVRGMQAVARARQEFERTHPPCSACGRRLNNEWDKTCNDCQREAAAAQRRS